tara:strand:- start:543 stop:758 length:216 start_codon:yes stop_codon:yes gene_type:complete
MSNDKEKLKQAHEEFFGDIKKAQKIVQDVVDKERDEINKMFSTIISRLESKIRTELMSELTEYKLNETRKK